MRRKNAQLITLGLGVVTSDLSSKTVIKEIEPIINQILRAMDAGLDRPNLSGQAMWLNSAVTYFERQKLKPLIHIPQSDWSENQMQSQSGLRLSTYPDKIYLHDQSESFALIEKSNIHEAIISPDGKHVAFFRTPDNASQRAEIWSVTVKKARARKVTEIPSCHTILFSLNGKWIFYQEKPTNRKSESVIGKVSVRGGETKNFRKSALTSVPD